MALPKKYFSILKDTSRSFYLGIMELKPEIREVVCLGYLFCRLMDLFEDATNVKVESRIKALEQLKGFLEDTNKNNANTVSSFKDYLGKHALEYSEYLNTHSHEQELYLTGADLLKEISKLDVATREIFKNSLLEMNEGMISQISKPKTNGLNEDDLDNYCYFVAGTVGVFLTNVFWKHNAFAPEVKIEDAMSDGIGFGKALQLVNISKDFYIDWDDSRVFWPEIDPQSPPTPQVIDRSLSKIENMFEEYSTQAKRYISYIAKEESEIKFFCEFPLQMALETMDIVTQRNWIVSRSAPKVSKTKTLSIVAQLKLS